MKTKSTKLHTQSKRKLKAHKITHTVKKKTKSTQNYTVYKDIQRKFPP